MNHRHDPRKGTHRLPGGTRSLPARNSHSPRMNSPRRCTDGGMLRSQLKHVRCAHRGLGIVTGRRKVSAERTTLRSHSSRASIAGENPLSHTDAQTLPGLPSVWGSATRNPSGREVSSGEF